METRHAVVSLGRTGDRGRPRLILLLLTYLQVRPCVTGAIQNKEPGHYLSGALLLRDLPLKQFLISMKSTVKANWTWVIKER